MAVAATDLLTSSDAADLTSYTTGSFTPTAGRPVLLAVGGETAAGSPANPTVTTTTGLVFVLVTSITSTNRRFSLYRACKASGLSTGTVTFDYGAATLTGCEWSITEFTGVDAGGTDGANLVVQFQSATGTSTTGSVTLAAFADAANGTYGTFSHNDNTNSVAGAGFTLLGNNVHTNPATGTASEYRADNDTSVDMTWNVSVAWRGIAVELKAAAAGTDATPTPSAVAAVASVPGPTITTGATPTPSTVTAIASVPGPTVTTGAKPTPATVAAVASVPGPTIGSVTSVLPATVAAIASVPAPTVKTGWTVTPATVAAVASVPAPTISLVTRPTPSTVVAVAAVPAPAIVLGAGPTPVTVATVASVPGPTIRLGTVTAPNTVAAVAAIPQPTITVPVPPNGCAHMTITWPHQAVLSIEQNHRADLAVTWPHDADLVTADC